MPELAEGYYWGVPQAVQARETDDGRKFLELHFVVTHRKTTDGYEDLPEQTDRSLTCWVHTQGGRGFTRKLLDERLGWNHRFGFEAEFHNLENGGCAFECRHQGKWEDWRIPRPSKSAGAGPRDLSDNERRDVLQSLYGSQDSPEASDSTLGETGGSAPF